MENFTEKNKFFIIIFSSIFIFGSVFISAQKLFFASSNLSKPIYRPATEEGVFFINEQTNQDKLFFVDRSINSLLKISVFVIIIFLFLVGGGLLIKRTITKARKKAQEKRNNKKREDVKDFQKTLEVFHRLFQRYPKARSNEFKIYINDSDDYYYENPKSDLQQYRIWCYLETDNKAKDKEIYEVQQPKAQSGIMAAPTEPPKTIST